MNRASDNLRLPWSTSRFHDARLEAFAAPVMLKETRTGVMAMALVSLVLQIASALLYAVQEAASDHYYTYTVLVVLSLHTFVAARLVKRLSELHLLGVVLLMMTGMAYVLLAAESGTMSAVLVASIVLLFLGVPLVPWGLREALAVIGLVYVLFTAAMFGNRHRFDVESQWTLQLLMMTAALVACVLVSRNAVVRREELRLRYELETSRRSLEDEAHRDVLTGAFNRRFLETHYQGLAERMLAVHGCFVFAFLDLDDFKDLNDRNGHGHGDQVLRALVEVLETLQDACVVRFGGDEFVVLFHADDPAAALTAALASLPEHPTGPNGTASIGAISITPTSLPSLVDAYAMADGLLYRAKAQKVPGTSRVVHDPQRAEVAA